IVTSHDISEPLFQGVNRAGSIDDLIGDPEIDLISICTPSNTHYDYAKRSLLAGKHVLIEKPITATYKEAIDLINIGKSAGKSIMVYQNRRFDGDFMTVKRVIESGILGDILSYEAR